MSNHQSRYRVEILDPNGNILADLSGRALQRTLSKMRNRADIITLKYDLNNIESLVSDIGIGFWDLFALNRNEIVIYRDDSPISAGQIYYARPLYGVDRQVIDIRAVGWLELLAKRFTGAEVTYSGIDAGQIAWDAIDDSQNLTDGDFGITQGTIQASVNRDRTYYSKNIKDLIIQLSEVQNGFDFEFTWDKQFNVYYPKIGSRLTDVIFRFPGNIKEFSFERDGTDMANEITTVGAGSGTDTLTATATDTSSRSTYKLRQDRRDFSDVIESATLTQHAEEELRVRRTFIDMPDIVLDGNRSPEFGSYNIGDEVLLESENQSVLGPANDYWRIDAMTLTVDENDSEEVRVRLLK